MSAMDILVVIYHLPAPVCPTLAGPLLSVASLMTVRTLEKKHIKANIHSPSHIDIIITPKIYIQKLSFHCFKIISHNRV